MLGHAVAPKHTRWAGPLFAGHKCSVGYEVIDAIQAYMCHGEGDIQGQPAHVDDEMADHIVECYRIDEITGRRVYNEAVLSRPKGRALATVTPVATPDGWTTMGQLEAGDVVFDERGEPTTVLSVSEVMVGRECFEVIFSDGERIIADAEHLWTVEELRKEYQEVTVDTSTLSRFRSTRTDGAANYRVQMNGPLNLPDAVDLPIDPYILGAWLGDGNNRDSQFTVHEADMPAFIAQVELAGYHLGSAKLNGSTYAIRVSSSPVIHGQWNGDSLVLRLRTAGLLCNKHVPAAYLRAGYKQRLAILQGLMDTDGTISPNGRAGFVSTRQELADGVVELLASLGVKSAKREFRTKIGAKDCGPGWHVDFWPGADIPVFRLPRKLARQKVKRTKARLADTRRIVAVEPVPSVPVRCIVVDSPKSLFLVGHRMVQTHNSKSEVAAWMATAEAFFPVRFDGWDASGQPVSRPVTSPLIKCLATEESQAGNTFRTIAYITGEWGQDSYPEIYAGTSGTRAYQSASAVYLPQGGEIRACTSGSASKDGGLESHVVVDESHLYILKELKDMYATIARNMGKRFAADPWIQQTSTAYKPGEQSVFEETLTAWRKGELSKAVYVNHREAKGKVDLDDEEHTKRQLRYVYGSAAEWIDMDRKYRDMRDPRICADAATAARYFLNRPLSSKDVWIPLHIVERQARPGIAATARSDRPGFHSVATGTPVCLGFDGSLNEDSTVLMASRMSDGLVFPVGIWSKPAGIEGMGWEVPRSEVLAAVRAAFTEYDVVRMYGDPHEWRTDLDSLASTLGEKRVIPWETRRDLQMASALGRLHTDLITSEVCHSGDPLVMEHFGNAYVRMKGRLRLVRKEKEETSRKIDAVVGATLAYEARADALAAGWTAVKKSSRVIVMR